MTSHGMFRSLGGLETLGDGTRTEQVRLPQAAGRVYTPSYGLDWGAPPPSAIDGAAALFNRHDLLKNCFKRNGLRLKASDGTGKQLSM